MFEKRFYFFLTKRIPQGKPQRCKELGSLGLLGDDGVGLFPPTLRGGSPEPPLFGIWVSRGFLRPSPTGYGKTSPPVFPVGSSPLNCRVIPLQIIYILSLIHISEPTRLLSISYAVFCLKKKNK